MNKQQECVKVVLKPGERSKRQPASQDQTIH
jgi:hypothetical protein